VEVLLRATRRLLIGATIIYCTAIIALSALWATVGQPTWWLALTNVFAAPLFVPLLPLIVAALVVRSWWMRGSVVVMAAVFLALFGPQLLPLPARPPAGTLLRVVTFNQLYSNDQVGAIVAAIRAQDADVVALQELSGAAAAALRSDLIAEYPYQYLAAAERDYGLGIISRYPLRMSSTTRGFLGRQVIVDVGGQPVTLINVHLTAPAIRTRRYREYGSLPWVSEYSTGERSREVPKLLAAIDETAGPLIVLGDFNTGDREPPYAELAARMHDAYRETSWGFGFTFPNDKRMWTMPIPLPLVRIDYVWSRGGIVPAAAHVECDSGGSDHCMLVADLRVGTGNDRVAKGTKLRIGRMEE
jgi:vancomycin resistance protein VanJ